MPDILLTPIDPLGTGKQASSARPETLRLLSGLEPGDLLSAQVLSKLPGGIFKVAVAGLQMRMALPDNVEPGETLELRFVAREPRLTFALKDTVPALSLSSAGRLLSALLPQGQPASAGPVFTAAPLAAPDNGAALSGELQQALTNSGLFYESHLAEWLAGTRDLAQILQEPQAQLAHNESPAPAPPPLDNQALALVQQQLAALDSARILLQLEIWPGQWLRWEVQEDEAAAKEQTPGWQTRLDLDLPQLGQLSAALTLSARGLDLRIDAAEDASASLLDNHRAELQQALAAASMPPATIAVRHHGKL